MYILTTLALSKYILSEICIRDQGNKKRMKMDQAQEEENNWVRAAAILSFIKLNSLLPVTTAAVWTPIERQKLLFGNATGRGHKNRICKDL